MANPYQPVAGTFKILETNSYRQFALPIAPREIKSGDACWLNTYTSTNSITSWCEPALNSPSGYSTKAAATSSSTGYGSASSSALVAEQEAFAALFIGIAQAHRTPRSYNKYLNYASNIPQSVINYDSSAPYFTVVTSGVADVPYWDGTNYAIPSGYAYPVGYGVALSGFKNASTYFVDASGITMSDTNYYLYNNCCCIANSTPLAWIGRLEKDAVAGDRFLRISFGNELTVMETNIIGYSGQVAGIGG